MKKHFLILTILMIFSFESIASWGEDGNGPNPKRQNTNGYTFNDGIKNITLKLKFSQLAANQDVCERDVNGCFKGYCILPGYTSFAPSPCRYTNNIYFFTDFVNNFKPEARIEFKEQLYRLSSKQRKTLRNSISKYEGPKFVHNQDRNTELDFLVAILTDSPTHQEKRKIEEENLMGFDVNTQFVTLFTKETKSVINDILLPELDILLSVDVVCEIFKFMKHDLSFLDSVGMVNSTFFLLAQYSWKDAYFLLTPKKFSPTSIPLLVKRNIRKIHFNFTNIPTKQVAIFKFLKNEKLLDKINSIKVTFFNKKNIYPVSISKLLIPEALMWFYPNYHKIKGDRSVFDPNLAYSFPKCRELEIDFYGKDLVRIFQKNFDEYNPWSILYNFYGNLKDLLAFVPKVKNTKLYGIKIENWPTSSEDMELCKKIKHWRGEAVLGNHTFSNAKMELIKKNLVVTDHSATEALLLLTMLEKNIPIASDVDKAIELTEGDEVHPQIQAKLLLALKKANLNPNIDLKKARRFIGDKRVKPQTKEKLLKIMVEKDLETLDHYERVNEHPQTQAEALLTILESYSTGIDCVERILKKYVIKAQRFIGDERVQSETQYLIKAWLHIYS